FRVLRNDLLAFTEGKTTGIYYHYFDKSNGFNTNEFNGGCHPCSVTLSDGRISLPSMNGLVVFHPDSIPQAIADADLFVDRVELDGSLLDSDGLINLPGQFSQLNIHVSSPFVGHPSNLQLMYRLVP